MKEVKRKLLPIGIENFEQMITNNYYYIDKTLMIRDLLDRGGYVNLFTRPRRFGKSLNISMLQYFFDHLVADKAHIFNELAISNTGPAYLARQNNYPVIQFGFKDVVSSHFTGRIQVQMPLSKI